eukprot:TRINITY_DN3878_c0_g1_i2.p1 TRINITY_DN3878_c0_g1~~TRINITY_DN3878_c0_g1_i2.p1  ORF type:complete len:100 (-),score=3.27 TRINITY_DN3878_c0_g1_i2:195-494(-)
MRRAYANVKNVELGNSYDNRCTTSRSGYSALGDQSHGNIRVQSILQAFVCITEDANAEHPHDLRPDLIPQSLFKSIFVSSFGTNVSAVCNGSKFATLKA